MSERPRFFRCFARWACRVPEILAGPVVDPDRPDLFSMTVNSFLPGRPLGSRAHMEIAAEAISRLHRAAPIIDVPRRSIADDLAELQVGPWWEVPGYREAIERLRPIVEAIDLPLVFSNGDLQPANFLTDNRVLTGMVDFEKAAYLDPLAVLARYPVYELPLARSGLIERVVRNEGLTMADFSVRVAVFALRTLKTKTPPVGGEPHQVALRKRLTEMIGPIVGD